jgi:hypothetical protein
LLTIGCAFSIRKPEIRLSVDLVWGFLLISTNAINRVSLDDQDPPKIHY